MKKALVAGMVLLAALAMPACDGSSSSNNNVAAILGALALQLNGGAGGDAAGAWGGDAGTVDMYSQAEGMILNSGAAAIPAYTMGANPEVIAASVSWTDAMNYGTDGQPGVAGFDDDGDTVIDNCNDFWWNGAGWTGDDGWYDDGFQVNVGVVITLDTDDLACTGGIYVVAGGPVVMVGSIVAAATNDWDVGVELFSYPDLSTEDGTIIVSGLINLTGPDNATGDGIPGGWIVLENDWNNGDAPIYLAGNIWSNGGDSTFTDGDGGYAGGIDIYGGNDADILVQANLVFNGGNADGTGWGGDGGWVNFDNEWGWDESTVGRIVVYNVNSIQANGGSSADDGGDGSDNIYLTSDEAGWLVQVPVVANGGDAGNTLGSVGGDGLTWAEVYSNEDYLDPIDLVANADVFLLGAWYGIGGDSAGVDGQGGQGGDVDEHYIYEGNYIGAPVIFGGGNALNTGGDGGYGGYFWVELSYVTDPGPYYLIQGAVFANGGNGEDWGGEGGDLYFHNHNDGNSSSYIVVGSGTQAFGGDGDDTLGQDGDVGYIEFDGNVILQ